MTDDADEGPKPVELFAGDTKLADAELVRGASNATLVFDLDLGSLPPLDAEWWVYDPAAPKN